MIGSRYQSRTRIFAVTMRWLYVNQMIVFNVKAQTLFAENENSGE